MIIFICTILYEKIEFNNCKIDNIFVSSFPCYFSNVIDNPSIHDINDNETIASQKVFLNFTLVINRKR